MLRTFSSEGALSATYVSHNASKSHKANTHQSLSTAYRTHFIVLLSYIFSVLSCPADGQIKVLAPTSLVNSIKSASPVDSDIIPGATSTFGAPTYGESFVGRVYFTPKTQTEYCSVDYKESITAMMNLPELSSDGLRKIFLLSRGNCSFVKKVSIAESLQADAVIFVDDAESVWTRKDMASVIVSDDGYGRYLHIPSILVTKDDGKTLVDAVGKLIDVVVQLQWSLPQKSIVSVDFWTESGSTIGQRFLTDYAYHASALRGHLAFNPHYTVYGLKTGAAPGVDDVLCYPGNKEICSNPPDILGTDVTGRDVLEENIRQLCLWNLMAKEVDGIPDSKYSSEWWEYVRKFSDSCSVLSFSQLNRFGTECSYKIMATIPSINVDEVVLCAANDGVTLLNNEKTNKAWSNLALRINGAKFSGALDPVQVSRAVCTAFESPPSACNQLTGQAPLPVTESSISIRTALWGLLGLGSCAGVAVYFFQGFMRKSMRTALRHEVMLEVRSQLQEYHELDEIEIPSRQKRPLISSRLI